jgi:holliday junction DNA helicase RuvA
MISRLRGKLLDVKNGEATIDVNGVGYAVKVPATFFQPLCTEIDMYIDTVVREESISLFGFESEMERSLFRLLYSISGIGPKTALAVVSYYSGDDLNRIISGRDVNMMSKVPGIGKKTAERIIMELKDKIENYVAGSSDVQCSQPSAYEDLVQALVGFGYKRNQAVEALKNKVEDINSGRAVEEVLRETLRNLSR